MKKHHKGKRKKTGHAKKAVESKKLKKSKHKVESDLKDDLLKKDIKKKRKRKHHHRKNKKFKKKKKLHDHEEEESHQKMRGVYVNPNMMSSNQFFVTPIPNYPKYPHNVRQHSLNSVLKGNRNPFKIPLRLRLRQRQRLIQNSQLAPIPVRAPIPYLPLGSVPTMVTQALDPPSSSVPMVPVVPSLPSRGPLSWLLKKTTMSNLSNNNESALSSILDNLALARLKQLNGSLPSLDSRQTSSLTSFPAAKTSLPVNISPPFVISSHDRGQSPSGQGSDHQLDHLPKLTSLTAPSVTFVEKLPEIQPLPYSDGQATSVPFPVTSSFTFVSKLSSTAPETISQSFPYVFASTPSILQVRDDTQCTSLTATCIT